MKGRWGWSWLVAVLGLAWGHAEPVQVVAVLSQEAGAVTVEMQMVGEVSTLPIRGAVVELRLYPFSGELKALLDEGGGALSRAGSAELPGDPVERASFAEPAGGGYEASIPEPPPGDYVLAIVDTTFKGEAAVAAKPVRFPLSAPGATLALELPETTTPNRYLVYALLGLALPALVGVGFALAARGDRKPQG